MSDLERLVDDLVARVGMLERENETLKKMVMPLQGRPVASVIEQHPVDRTMTRRSMMSRTAQVTVAAIAAGVVITNDFDDASAQSGFFTNLTATTVRTDYLLVDNPNKERAAEIYTSSTTSPALSVGNFGGEIAIDATSRGPFAGSRPAVRGINDTSLGAGVQGVSNSGDALNGFSRTGVGVRGLSLTGYGGVFQGRRAQIRIVPTGRVGAPVNGTHQIGELYLDREGSLFLCTAKGTPGTWRTVTLN